MARGPVSFLARVVRQPGRRRIAANTAWLFIDKAVCVVVGLSVGVWVARYLKPTSFGLLNYALAVVHFFVPITGLGLKNIVVRNLVRAPETRDEVIGTTLVLRLGVSLCVVLGLGISFACGLGPGNGMVRWLIVIVSGQLVFNALGEPVGFWFESQLQSKYTVWARDVSVVLAGLLKVGLILVGASLLAFAVATTLQTLVFAVALIVFWRLVGNRFFGLRGSIKCAKRMLSDSWPLIFSALAVVTYMRIDQVMLGHLAGAEALGTYSVAVRLSELWYFIPMAIAQSLFPAIVRSREIHSEEGYHHRIQAFFDLMSAVAYVIVVPLSLIAVPLVSVLFGAEYAEAGPVLRVHIWAFVFVSLGAARSRWLTTEGIIRFQLFSTLLGAGINVVLNIFLIPRYVGLGAAWATLISYGLAAYISSVCYGPVRSVFKKLTLALLVPFRPVSLWRSFADGFHS